MPATARECATSLNSSAIMAAAAESLIAISANLKLGGLRSRIEWYLHVRRIRLVRPRLFHFFRERREDLEQIADDAEVGDAEDRSLGIFVDRDDVLR